MIYCPARGRVESCHLEAATSAVLFRSANSPTLRRHERPAGTLCTLIDDDRQASGSRWHQSRRRRQPVDEAAAPCYQSFPATRAQSLCIGSVPVRVVVAISRQTPHSSGCRSYQAVDAFATSRLAQEAKVSTAVFVWPKPKSGPKGPSQDLIQAIVELKQRNPRFGCRRIAQQINKAFDVQIDKDIVRRVLAKHYHPTPGDNGPSWLSFLGHMKDSLWSIDLFRCESILLKSHWVLVIMDQFTRRIIGFGVHAGDVDGVVLCRLFNNAISTQDIPRYISSDNDPLFRYHRWQANLRILDVEEIKALPYTPLSHPFVERLIGTIRREYLDHTLFWNAEDLERKLEDFRQYYHRHRVHQSLDGDTPAAVCGEAQTQPANLCHYSWRSHCRGLFQTPLAA